MVNLRTIVNCDRTVVAPALAELVGRNAEALSVDFPSTAARYATADKANDRLVKLQIEISINEGRSGVLLVENDDDLLGMVTYAQTRKWFRLPGDLLLTHFNGPLIAGWLDQNRPNRLRRIGIEVLRQMASEIAANNHLKGTPWTFVRPNNHPAVRRITAVDNGFGGFVAIGEPRDYSSIDGVKAPRQLYVGNYDVRHLAG